MISGISGGIAVSLSSIFGLLQVQKKSEKESLPGSIFLTADHGSRIVYSCKGTPRYSRVPAVFTLEAAVILPLLACFFVSILFFFRVMQVQLEVQKALNDTGRQLAVCGMSDEAVPAAAWALLQKELKGREEAERYIRGGSAGISLLRSDFRGEELCLNAEYQIRLPIGIFGIDGYRVEQQAVCRKWIGWNGSSAADAADTWVYVTESGTVYHTARSCTHLALSVHTADYATVAFLRNEDGERYNACEHCGKNAVTGGKVYIADHGNCYHTDPGCSGIRRTVFMVRLSDVAGRRKCSRCGTI